MRGTISTRDGCCGGNVELRLFPRERRGCGCGEDEEPVVFEAWELELLPPLRNRSWSRWCRGSRWEV